MVFPLWWCANGGATEAFLQSFVGDGVIWPVLRRKIKSNH
jgi:hypothetical protein